MLLQQSSHHTFIQPAHNFNALQIQLYLHILFLKWQVHVLLQMHRLCACCTTSASMCLGCTVTNFCPAATTLGPCECCCADRSPVFHHLVLRCVSQRFLQAPSLPLPTGAARQPVYCIMIMSIRPASASSCHHGLTHLNAITHHAITCLSAWQLKDDTSLQHKCQPWLLQQASIRTDILLTFGCCLVQGARGG